MNIRELFNAEIERLPEPILQEFLDCIELLQRKYKQISTSSDSQLAPAAINNNTPKSQVLKIS